MGPERTIETYVRTCLHFACQNPQTTKACLLCLHSFFVWSVAWRLESHAAMCYLPCWWVYHPPGVRPSPSPSPAPFVTPSWSFNLFVFVVVVNVDSVAVAQMLPRSFYFYFLQLTLSAPKACSLFWALCASVCVCVSDRKRWGSMALPDFRSSPLMRISSADHSEYSLTPTV